MIACVVAKSGDRWRCDKNNYIVAFIVNVAVVPMGP